MPVVPEQAGNIYSRLLRNIIMPSPAFRRPICVLHKTLNEFCSSLHSITLFVIYCLLDIVQVVIKILSPTLLALTLPALIFKKPTKTTLRRQVQLSISLLQKYFQLLSVNHNFSAIEKRPEISVRVMTRSRQNYFQQF